MIISLQGADLVKYGEIVLEVSMIDIDMIATHIIITERCVLFTLVPDVCLSFIGLSFSEYSSSCLQ